MRKIWVLLILILSAPIICQTNTFKIDDASLSYGDTARVRLILDNSVSVNGLNSVLEFDSDLLKMVGFISLNRSTSLSSAEANIFSENKISLVVFDETGAFLEPDSGSIFELIFVLNDTSFVADTSTQVLFYQSSIVDSVLNLISFSYINGTIQVEGPTSIESGIL